MGSIPACAGEPMVVRRMAESCGVYPRVCGGTADQPPSSLSPPGLSPRVRGNPVIIAYYYHTLGSIPACAGEPDCSFHACLLYRVYPRVCGGTSGTRSGGGLCGGLSPRVRGNRRRCPGCRRSGGSIPACAGEPRRNHRSASCLRVYPRVCGGTLKRQRDIMTTLGLSPRVRGNPFAADPTIRATGSIPACAGEPIRCSTRRYPRRVYPRVCGGTTSSASGVADDSGLSPRVRGNPGWCVRRRNHLGSIPACAGEPPLPLSESLKSRVYPRVCGGTSCS